MKETGLVVTVKDGFAVVKVEREIPVDCCNKTSKKESYFIKAHNLCNAEINNRVFVETENSLSPSMKLLMIGVCVISFISGLVLGERFSFFPGLSFYNDLLSFGLAIILTIIAFTGFRYFTTKGKNTTPVISGIFYN
jgi:hypothetical protein